MVNGTWRALLFPPTHRGVERAAGRHPRRDMRSRGRTGGKGPKGIGLDGRSFSLRQEPNRKPPPDRPSPKGRQPSNTAAQRHPFPRDGTACRAEGGARQIPPTPHKANARAKPSQTHGEPKNAQRA
jgi:hypothetical protein